MKILQIQFSSTKEWVDFSCTESKTLQEAWDELPVKPTVPCRISFKNEVYSKCFNGFEIK